MALIALARLLGFFPPCGVLRVNTDRLPILMCIYYFRASQTKFDFS